MNNKNTPPSRQSNFEALRLLCMLMVLNLHSFWGYSHGEGISQALDFYRESTSICAVDCFILISGYFGIKWKFKSFFNLVFQLFFYSIGIYLVVTRLGIVDWDLKEFIKRFACLIRNSWGFAITYVLLWFCAPPLNALAEKLNGRELFFYILIFFFMLNFISVPDNALFTYALVYLIGRLLRKVKVEEVYFPSGKAFWVTTTLIFVLVYFLIFKVLHITDAEKVCGWPIGFIGYDYKAPLVILQSVFLFMFFSRLKFQSKFINWCAASCFAIFLIHMHPTIKQIGYYAFTESLYAYPVWKHILLLSGLITGVFFASIFIDKVRLIISNCCYLMIEKIACLIPKRCCKLETFMPRFAATLDSK